MSRVDRHEGLLPCGIVESAADENAVPFVQYARVYIEFAIDQLKDVNSHALADREETIWQGGPEAELNIVAFVARSVHQNVRTAAQRHCRHL